jgi:hypothetical protein
VLPNLLRHLSAESGRRKFSPTSEARHFLFPTDYLYNNADEEMMLKRRYDLDLDIVRESSKVTKEVPIERAYDFSFAKKADSELTQAGWKP